VVVQHPRPSGLKFKPFDLGASAPWLQRQLELQRQRRRPPGRRGLSPRELALVDRFKRLKNEAGTHSPSAWTLAKLMPELRLKVDACFLSNPYATKLFLMHFQREVIRPRKLRALLELYPSQNPVIAAKLGRVLDLAPESIFVGNGAAEIIQAILHRFTKSKLLVNLPTFSPYYEFTRPDTQVVFNVLRKEDNFRFDPEAYVRLVERERPDTVVLINPNNPDGGYVPHTTMRRLLEQLRFVPNVIVDESFIHFACEGTDYSYRSLADYAGRFPNLIVVKSMSKDFGVAGIRAGYAVMAPNRVQTLLENGYLWNSSGLAEYFFDLYSRPDFQLQYERERIRFIRNSQRYFAAMAKIDGLHVYPTFANFALVELGAGLNADDLVCRLLIRRGIYTRSCDDKKGLEAGKFVRIAARNRPENAYIIRSLRRLIG
jgi:histidinol-phosphate/aromatic aminotransferase/cobyric acid decarboxylase-like protein